jgi:hypothetical protein
MVEGGESRFALNSPSHTFYQPGGTRNGELFLRKQRLTSTMLDNLKRDAVRVTLQLVSYRDEDKSNSQGSTLHQVNGKTTAKPNQFYYLRCSAFNATGWYRFMWNSILSLRISQSRPKYWFYRYLLLHWSTSMSKGACPRYQWDEWKAMLQSKSRSQSAS